MLPPSCRVYLFFFIFLFVFEFQGSVFYVRKGIFFEYRLQVVYRAACENAILFAELDQALEEAYPVVYLLKLRSATVLAELDTAVAYVSLCVYLAIPRFEYRRYILDALGALDLAFEVGYPGKAFAVVVVAAALWHEVVDDALEACVVDQDILPRAEGEVACVDMYVHPAAAIHLRVYFLQSLANALYLLQPVFALENRADQLERVASADRRVGYQLPVWARGVVVSFALALDARAAEAVEEVGLVDAVGFYLDAEAACKGGRGKAGRDLLYRRRALHLLIYVIYKAVISVRYEVGYLAAGESELQELLNLAGFRCVLRKNSLYLLFHIGVLFCTSKVATKNGTRKS